LLDDMLDVSCIKHGQLRIETKSVGLHSTLDQIVHLFEAKQKNFVLRACIDENLPAHVSADPLRSRQILISLVNNALKIHGRRFCRDQD